MITKTKKSKAIGRPRKQNVEPEEKLITPPQASGAVKTILIPEPKQCRIQVKIEGTTPLLFNPRTRTILRDILKAQGYEDPEFEKELKKMSKEDREQMDLPANKRTRNPEREFRDKLTARSMNGMEGPFWFPAVGIKKAMTTAGMRFVEKTQQTVLRGLFFVHPDRVVIETTAKPTMRQDSGFPQGPKKAMHVFFRPELFPWSMTFMIDFLSAQISIQSVLSLLKYAGNSVGLGPWRIESGGNHGTFVLATVSEMVIKQV